MTFSYEASYLADRDAYPLDPSLPLFEGGQQTPEGFKIFGAFSDSAPDRWGRRLIARNESKRVEREGGAQRTFGEFEFMIGVDDEVRQGALRFRRPGSKDFLAVEGSGIPPLVDLPMLLGAAERLERGEEDQRDLNLLLRGGSSLGGARPKAQVRLDDERIAIAKFPSPETDDWDVMRWEAVALELASRAGIQAPHNELHEIDGRPVLILDRFDRNGPIRIGYASALTMLQLSDGDDASYLDIAEILATQSPEATKDVHELWRRMAFSVLISNFDDHLRNHGFLRKSSAGWSMSPAFDLNPDPRPGPRHLRTSIDESNPEASIGLLLQVAESFRLTPEDAIKTLRQVTRSTLAWRDVARSFGLNKELERMAPAFEHSASQEARQLTS